jgi:hypothetical protein
VPDGPGRAEGLTLGGLAALIWAAHALDSVWLGLAPDLLWMCNLGGLLLAVGLASRSPRLVALTASWMVLGVPLWALDVLLTGQTRPSSVLSHLGGLSLALYGVSRLGWPPRTWLLASLALSALLLLCRALTPSEANVNLVFEVWPLLQGKVGHGVYLVLLGGLAAGVFALLDALASRMVRAPSARGT